MKKHLLSLCLLTLVAYGRMLASEGPDASQKMARAAVKQYTKERIMPVLLQKRQQLEGELSTSEKDEIAQCRTTLKQLREQRREFMQQKPEGMPMHDYMEGNGQNQGYEMHQQMRAVMEKLEAIAAKHSNTLDNFKTQLTPAVKQWKEDIAKLLPQSKNDEGQWHSYHHGFEGPMMHGLNGQHAQAVFLLLSANSQENDENILDGSDNDLKSDMLGANTQTSATATPALDITSFQVSPNPTANEIVIANTALPGANQLDVYDMQGKVVATYQNVQPSQHIDMSNLANGTYMVQLKSGSQQQNLKVVVSR